MKIFRPILSLILVLATTLLVSCSGPGASAPPTYTPEKLQKISTYRIPLDVARQRIPELGQYIENEDWVDADTFLHGPLGLIRRDLTYLSNALLPDEQKPALDVAKDIFKHIENIDAAVDDKNYRVAISQYKEMVSDFDSYSSLIPETKKPVAQSAKTSAKVIEKKAAKKATKAVKKAENIFEEVQADVEETVEDTIEQISPVSDDNS